MVFYRQNEALVAAAQAALYNAATGKAPLPDELVPVELESISDDGDTEFVVDKKEGKVTLFACFQRALSQEWAKIGPAGQKVYEERALVWRANGPTAEEQKRSVSPDFLSDVLYQPLTYFSQYGGGERPSLHSSVCHRAV